MYLNRRPHHTLLLLSVLAALPLVTAIAGDSYQERLDRLRQLAQNEPQKIEDLRRKKERFEKLAPEEQARIRELHEQLNSSADGEQLQQVMVRYNDWLKTLTTAQRAELKGLPPDERVARIKQFKGEQAVRNFGVFSETGLPPEDLPTIFAWVSTYLDRHEEELIERMPPMMQQQLPRMDDRNRRRMLLFTLARRRPGTEMPRPEQAEIRELIDQLSPQAQAILQNEPDGRRKAAIVLRWIQAAIVAQILPAVSDEELQRFFNEELPREERDMLDGLSPDQRYRQLRRLYYTHRFNRPGPGFGRDGGPRPPGGGPPPFPPDDPGRPFGPPGGRPPNRAPDRPPPQ